MSAIRPACRKPRPHGPSRAPAARGGARSLGAAALPLLLLSFLAAGAATGASPAPARILVKNATIWTMGPAGVVEKGDLLVENGKIVKVGGTIAAPKDALVVDGTGRHVTPGILDCHSHTAIDGEVNEATHNVTAEVRVGDVIDHEDINIYRQLAGGVTTIHTLHGSANSIGGQNAVIRLKWGRPAAELLFPGAPKSIKFALGENPKQASWGETLDRYPKTRMGVEESIRSSLLAARDNRAEWTKERDALGRKNDHRVPPRRDLQLDALNEILDGTLWIHSHAYRQDEILMLMRLGDSLGFRVHTFQHVLEGYKVADELAAHAAGASSIPDWWAYKYEAWDAIPYNATLMTRRGVLTSIGSDSPELARHLNVDAAKSMKYGGLSGVEALSLVTINPAKQLGIDGRTGSLEAGKDADFVVWSGDPTSVYSIVESTWIEGVKYFDRADDLAGRAKVEEARAALIGRILSSSKAAATVPAIAEAQVGPSYPTPKPGPAPDGGPVTALVGATVHTVSGADIPRGTVIIRGGKIAAVGQGIAVPPGATTVDLAGRHLYPSMIDPATTLGLVEIGSVRGTVDTTEIGRINPDIRVESSVNPSSEAIPVTRSNGVLVALTVPQGALLRGASALMRLDGWTWEEMTLRAPVGMHLTWPYVKVPTDGREPRKTEEDIRKEKDDSLKDLRTAMAAARAYLKAKQAAAEGRAEAPEADAKWEAMIPVLQGTLPMIVDASDTRQIRDAVAWAEAEKVPIILSGARDAWRVAELLAKKHVPVILGPVLSLPAQEDEPYDTPFTAAEKLREAGVLFAFSNGGASNVRNLPYQASAAAAFGLPRSEALKGVTLYPARILGVEDRLGSIEPGKDATFFVADGDPLEVRTQVLRAWIDGREVSLDDRQKQLYEKYRNRPRAAGGGS